MFSGKKSFQLKYWHFLLIAKNPDPPSPFVCVHSLQQLKNTPFLRSGQAHREHDAAIFNLWKSWTIPINKLKNGWIFILTVLDVQLLNYFLNSHISGLCSKTAVNQKALLTGFKLGDGSSKKPFKFFCLHSLRSTQGNHWSWRQNSSFPLATIFRNFAFKIFSF